MKYLLGMTDKEIEIMADRYFHVEKQLPPPTLNDNPPIQLKPCFKCGIQTNETYSIYGVGHYKCYMLINKS